MQAGKIHPDLWEQWLCKETGWTYAELQATPFYWVNRMAMMISAQNLADKREMDKAGKP